MTRINKVLIIGGSGFIGSRLIKRLRRRHPLLTVGILDKRKSKDFPEITVLGDVRSRDDVFEAALGYDVIVNLAAEHRDDVSPSSLYYDVNVLGAVNTCTAARLNNVRRIVFTSSVAVYGYCSAITSEAGELTPVNDYGKSKLEAERVFRAWQAESPNERTLVIIRPTVVFGEQNRGNVYNLLRQIAVGNFIMIGSGGNVKSLAYVENVAAFIEHSTGFGPGVHVYNYVDKPDFSMNQLVDFVRSVLGRPESTSWRVPYVFGYVLGKAFDLVAAILRRKLVISSIRVKKFCANSVYSSAIYELGFSPPVTLEQALERTIRYEFIEKNSDEPTLI